MIDYNDKDLFNFKEFNSKKLNNTFNKLKELKKYNKLLKKTVYFQNRFHCRLLKLALNMAYYSNDSSKYKLKVKNRGLARASSARRQKRIYDQTHLKVM